MGEFLETARQGGLPQTLVFARIRMEAHPDYEELRQLLQDRLLRFERFRSVVSFRGRRMFWTEVPLPELDWGYHLSTTPREVSMEELQAQGLDHSRPRWKSILGTCGGSPTLFFVVDHVIADGVTLTEVLFSLGVQPHDATLPQADTRESLSGAKKEREAASRFFCALQALPKVIVNTCRTFEWFLPDVGRKAATALKLKPGMRRSMTHSFATSEKPIALADVKSCKLKVPSLTVTDLLFAAMVLAVRRALRRAGDSAQRRVGFAVIGNLRKVSFWDDPEGQFGNRAWTFPFRMNLATARGVAEGGDRISVLREVKGKLEVLKNQVWISFFFWHVVPLLVRAGPRFLGKMMNYPSTDPSTVMLAPVKGPETRLNIASRDVVGLDFFVTPIAQLYAGIVSYAGEVRMTLAIDPRLLDSPAQLFFCEAFREEFYGLKVELETASSSELATFTQRGASLRSQMLGLLASSLVFCSDAFDWMCRPGPLRRFFTTATKRVIERARKNGGGIAIGRGRKR